MSNRKAYSYVSTVVLPVIFGTSFVFFSPLRAHLRHNIGPDKVKAMQYLVRGDKSLNTGLNQSIPSTYTGATFVYGQDDMTRTTEAIGPQEILGPKELAHLHRKHSNFPKGKIHSSKNQTAKMENGVLNRIFTKNSTSKSSFLIKDFLLVDGSRSRQSAFLERVKRSHRRSRNRKNDQPPMGKSAMRFARRPIYEADERQLLEMYEKEIQTIQKNRFKALLLKKLRMSEEELSKTPVSHDFPKLPLNFWEEFHNESAKQENSKSFYAQEEELVIEGKVMRKCLPGHQVTGCYRFVIKGNIHGKVASAQLWFFKKPDGNDVNGQTFSVFQSDQRRRGRHRCRSLEIRQDTSTHQGWITMNVTSSVKCWADAHMHFVTLAIRCETCRTSDHKALYGAQSGYKPLLILKYDTKNSPDRERRSAAECDARYECCKQDYTINFSDIGLYQISAPSSLNVGYCVGSCNLPVNDSHSYLRLLSRLRNPHLPEAIRNQIAPCCVPQTKRGASFLYHLPDGVARIDVSNVKVVSCGCLN